MADYAGMQFLRKYKAIVALVPLLSMIACLFTSEPKLPQGAEAMSPPAVYRLWWQMTQACSGRSRDFASIEWYRTPGQSFVVNGIEAAGVSIGNRIVVAADFLYDGRVVRHEMLHALLRDPGHPRAAFLGACASIVVCTSQCVRDAGSWRAPSRYDLLDPDSLEVSAKLEVTPVDGDGERWLLAWVSVHNPRDRAVLITAPGDPRTPHSFDYQIWGQFGGLQAGNVAVDSSTLFFAPFETKRSLFEFRRGSPLSLYTDPIVLPPATYTVRGAYADHWSEFGTVALP